MKNVTTAGERDAMKRYYNTVTFPSEQRARNALHCDSIRFLLSKGCSRCDEKDFCVLRFYDDEIMPVDIPIVLGKYKKYSVVLAIAKSSIILCANCAARNVVSLYSELKDI